MIRSKKYSTFTNDEIIELSRQKLNDKQRYYLLQEISHRDLEAEVSRANKQFHKEKFKAEWYKRPVAKVVFLIFMIGLAIRKFMNGF